MLSRTARFSFSEEVVGAVRDVEDAVGFSGLK